jgi:2-aminoethylphosphonate aminotransferase
MIQYKLFNPGPANTSDRVKNSVIECGDVCPRELETGNLMKEISERIKFLLTTNPDQFECVLFTSSGTGAVESVISSLPENANVLNIVNGSYGNRIADMLSVYKISHENVDFAEGTIDLSLVEDVLSAKEFTHISFIHCETTTGIINDLRAISKLAKKYNCKIVVDAMSSAFAYPIDMEKDGIEFLCCSSNKLVQGLPGIGIVLVDKKEISDCFNRTVYLDLKSQIESFRKTNQMRFTPAVQILYSLREALCELEEEGISNRFKRYENLNVIIREQLEDLGLRALIKKELNSIVITSFIEPVGFDFHSFHGFLKSKGFVIYPGKVNSNNTFRLSNIGELTEEDVNNFINSVKTYFNVRQLSY